MNILITQVVTYEKKKGFIFSLSKDWIDYASKIGLNLIPYNYNFKKSKLDKIKIDGLILSGGNDLSILKENKANFFRDSHELKILKYCLNNKIPILGICRGFQFISSYYKSKIYRCKKHVGTFHRINVMKSNYINSKKLHINSFHNFCINQLFKKFNIISIYNDKSIEIAEYPEKKILCFMFHPERKNFTQRSIDKYILNFFNKK